MPRLEGHRVRVKFRRNPMTGESWFTWQCTCEERGWRQFPTGRAAREGGRAHISEVRPR